MQEQMPLTQLVAAAGGVDLEGAGVVVVQVVLVMDPLREAQERLGQVAGAP